MTNRLLGEAHGIEVHVLAERVRLVHRSLLPALYTLVRRGRTISDLDGLSLRARSALSLLRAREIEGALRRSAALGALAVVGTGRKRIAPCKAGSSRDRRWTL